MNSNKRQFFTAGQSPLQTGSQNSRKHKFSNFTGHSVPTSTIPITNTNSLPGNTGKIANTEQINQKPIQEGPVNRRQTIKNNVNPTINTIVQNYETQNIKQAQPFTNEVIGFDSGQKKQIAAIKIQQKCVICGTTTQKCCSLCRKMFYCSSQHQEIDWHMRHKFQCEGKIQQMKPVEGQSNPAFGSNNTNKFVFYSNNSQQSQPKNSQMYEKQMDYRAIQRFLQLLEQRLVMRSKIMGQIVKLNERTPLIVRESLVKQTQELLELSSRITNQEFKPSYSRKITKKDILDYSSQQWGSGIVLTQAGVGLEYYADLVLMIKMYHLCGMNKQAREAIISIGKLLEDPDQKMLFLDVTHGKHGGVEKKLSFTSVNSSPLPNSNANALFNSTNSAPINFLQKQDKGEDSLTKTRNLILEQISRLSEAYNIDKTTESVYKLFIKKVQIQEGIWEQIYAYFNVGVWYMEKTYYDKSIKSFLYALELLEGHKKGVAESVVFKADCLFNIGLNYWALGQSSLAIQNMQLCYRSRMNSIGKNSMESSYCIYHLAKWYKALQKWNECLQYLDQCHRIRKLYDKQPIYESKIEQIKTLISQVYEIIRREKKKHAEILDPKSQKYFSQILEKEEDQERRSQAKRNQQNQLLPKGTVASRLFRDDREYVKFSFAISEELFQSLKPKQVQLLASLFQFTDQRMEKYQAYRVLAESDFVGSLSNEQRELFFKENKIQKSVK